MKSIRNRLGGQWGVAPGADIDDRVDLSLFFMASFRIFAGSSIIAESNAPAIILPRGKSFCSSGGK
jgi:hypothetical protein